MVVDHYFVEAVKLSDQDPLGVIRLELLIVRVAQDYSGRQIVQIQLVTVVMLDHKAELLHLCTSEGLFANHLAFIHSELVGVR